MSAVASPFSFHCMICFEEFHSETRYPVVLPCGHTYVCNVCADRLEKCMECRTPLTIWTADPPNRPPPHNNSTTGGPRPSSRWGAAARRGDPQSFRPTLPTPPAPPTKTRLPLPKNVVLLSLMEATELTTEREKPASPVLTNVSSSFHQDDEPEEEEEDKIREGTSLAISGCGTYVVRCHEGLLIYPTRPLGNAPRDLSASNFGQEQDVDTLVRFFHLDQGGGGDSVKLNHGQLSFGDRLQIVSLEDGWAKLARGYGFIHADHNQIVKVGGYMDRACVLEAMLHSLSIRRKDLRREQAKVDSKFVLLMNELQTSLLNDEDLTVIVAETFSEQDAGEQAAMETRSSVDSQHKNTENQENAGREMDKATTKATSPVTVNTHGLVLGDYDMSQPIALARQETPQALLQSSSSGLGCGFTFPEISPTRRHAPLLSSPNGSTSQQQSLSEGARAWRERHGREASNGIDFRTGMSGHHALLSTHAHPHEYLRRGGSARMLGMSNHTGLSMYKSVRKAPSFPPPEGGQDQEE